MRKQHVDLRAGRARPIAPPPVITTTCSRCHVSHVSSHPALPEGWAIVKAGVRCADCAPAARGASAQHRKGGEA